MRTCCVNTLGRLKSRGSELALAFLAVIKKLMEALLPNRIESRTSNYKTDIGLGRPRAWPQAERDDGAGNR